METGTKRAVWITLSKGHWGSIKALSGVSWLVPLISAGLFAAELWRDAVLRQAHHWRQEELQRLRGERQLQRWKHHRPCQKEEAGCIKLCESYKFVFSPPPVSRYSGFSFFSFFFPFFFVFWKMHTLSPQNQFTLNPYKAMLFYWLGEEQI